MFSLKAMLLSGVNHKQILESRKEITIFIYCFQLKIFPFQIVNFLMCTSDAHLLISLPSLLLWRGWGETYWHEDEKRGNKTRTASEGSPTVWCAVWSGCTRSVLFQRHLDTEWPTALLLPWQQLAHNKSNQVSAIWRQMVKPMACYLETVYCVPMLGDVSLVSLLAHRLNNWIIRIPCHERRRNNWHWQECLRLKDPLRGWLLTILNKVEYFPWVL